MFYRENPPYFIRVILSQAVRFGLGVDEVTNFFIDKLNSAPVVVHVNFSPITCLCRHNLLSFVEPTDY